jgi:hypothetical protein
MKVLMQNLAARLQRQSPLTITITGLCCALALGIPDRYIQRPMSFMLFDLAVVVFVGWGAGKWPALVVSGVAVATMAAVQWGWRRDAVPPGWVFVWNHAMRFVVLGVAGWLTAEVARLTRHLSDLVEERTAQWKAEVEQHKATSTRLTEAIERFEQVINNITEVFWLTNVAKNEMAYISPGYERVWGRQCEELYRDPHSWLAALHPEDREAIARRARTDQAGGSYDVEYRILRPDGAVRWIRDRAFPVRNPQGEVYRIAGIADDITERKRTREVLQTQAAILENMAEGVVVTDEKGVIVQMNPAGERIWGFARNEVLGQPASVFSALPEPEATMVMLEVLAALQATGVWRGTFHNRRKDGALIYCEAVINQLEVQGRRLMVAVEQDVTERLRAQEQLQMQARVLESMAEAVMMLDEQGTIVLTNRAQDALLGYERGELAGKPMLVVSGHPPEQYRKEFEAMLEQIKTRGPVAGEHIVRRKDGGLIAVQTRSSGLSVGGRFCLVVVGQDITERKRAEEALRQSEETLRVFLDALPEPALLLDRNGTILASNRALGHSLGRPERELAGQNAFGLIPPMLAETRKAMFDEVIRTRKAAYYEDTRAGRHFVNFQSPVLDSVGNVTRVALCALDITERKQVESALARQEALYHTLFELSPDGILLEDASGNILDANRAFCQSSGYSREELLQHNVRRLVPADGQAEVEAHLAALRAGQTLDHKTWNVRKNGERCLMRLSEKPLTLPDGLQGILVVARDITRSERTEVTKAVFLSLAAKLSSVQTPVEAARAIYASADQLWKWDAATLDLYTEDKDTMDSVLLCDVVDGQRREVASPQPMGPPTARLRRVMQQGAELILRTEADAPTGDSVSFGDSSHLSASIMCAPMRRDGQAMGVLSIQSYTRNAYSQEDLRTLQALADYCAGALERIRTEQALREAHDELERRVQNRTAELRAANAALRESEGKYRRLHESMTDAFVGVDIAGRITDFNPAYQALLGYTAEELRQKTYVELTPQKWHAFEARVVAEQILPRGYSEVYEKEYCRKDGTIFPVELRTFLIRDANGQPAAMWAIVRDITERKLAEQALCELNDQLERRVQQRTAELQATNAALAESEERYRSLVNNLNVGVYRNTPGPHGRFIQVNPALARMHGYDSVEEFQEVRVADLYQDPGEREVFVAGLLHEGAVVNHELRLKKKDGTAIYASVNAAVHRAPNGEVNWIDGVLEDITQRKQAEEALREAQRLQKAILDNLPDPVWLKDAKGRFLACNQALARVYRKPMEAIIGKTASDFAPHEAAGFSRQDRQVIKSRQSIMVDVPVRDAQGQVRWFETIKSAVLNERGEVTAMVGASREVTERKRAEDALKMQSLILQNMAEGALLIGPDQKILFANSALEAAFGYEPGELIGKSVAVLNAWPEAETARFNQQVVRAARRNRLWIGEYQNRRKDGTLFTSEARISLLDLGGQVHYVTVQQDITDRKRLERQILEISDREQARIGQDIHDGLCQHLVSLAFDANSLQQRLTAQRRPEAETAQRLADLLDQTISESRQLSRGLFPVRLEKEGLAPALDELAKATRDRLKLRCRFEGKGPGALENSTIATHLYRIAQEALTNAVKHSRAQSVRISLRDNAGQLELRVEDDGAGFSPGAQKQSKGLGLHIMEYRARMVGGSLHLKPGRRGGTVVSCCVPYPPS